METHSRPSDPQNPRRILDAQLREAFGRIAYSHKVHEKQADILLTRLSRVKLSQIVLSAISMAGFLSVLLDTGVWGSLVGAMFAAVLLALNLYTRDYDLGKQAQQHRDAANKLWFMREQGLSLIVDLTVSFDTLPDIRAKRDAYTREVRDIYASVPSTTPAAYKRARQALNVDHEMTFSVAEVDSLLPEELRRRE